MLADRVAGALWGMFIADALAMPVHWFYGGNAQIRAMFGKNISAYEKPPQSFPGSIMALSDTGGAGRGSSDGDIIGTVINHGKKKFWQGSYHYHCTLPAGGTTLEGEMARLAMRSMTQGTGFDLDRMQADYVQFMTKPGSHSDAYASSYHRMFFARRAQGFALRDCPSNDGHNVDAIDGLIIPTVVMLGGVSAPEPTTRVVAQQSVLVTRKSAMVETYVGELSLMLRAVLNGQTAAEAAQDASRRVFGRAISTWQPDPVVACYIEPNFKSLLLLAAKYTGFEGCLIANANAGGENVHRGIVLGALLGAQTGASGIPDSLKKGLARYADLESEINAFVEARVVPTAISHVEEL